MGGPFADGTGGLVVLSVGDIAEARLLIADDPAVVAGTLKTTIHGWNRVV